ncbi:hypothetical protein [Virgisporangium ochraceum]|uniref:hypothetical protein n=1 Tax=Virgisporangium ochraceum TaxID=65505 RepID=UPI00194112CC|nr:hypothetical protein [Virgisporangium ochraceum]
MFVTAAPVHVGIRGMLDDLHREWPDMVVAIGESGTFTRWAMARGVVPTGAGEVLVARDEGMEQRWDRDGWILMERDEGPFAVFYQPAPIPSVDIQFNDDPYGRGFTFEPYGATMLTAGLFLVTVVTPDRDSPFTRQVLLRLQRALTSQADPGCR